MTKRSYPLPRQAPAPSQTPVPEYGEPTPSEPVEVTDPGEDETPDTPEETD